MVSTATIALVDLVLGSTAAVALLYLLYSGTVVVHSTGSSASSPSGSSSMP